jgi:hypothetical protein
VKALAGQFSVTAWDEDTYEDRPAGKLTRATVEQDFTGGVDGQGSVVWLMCYRQDGTADFVGLQEIHGNLDGLDGGFVLTSAGTFDGEKAEGRWAVVSGSGTGDLSGIDGTGEFIAPHGGQPTFELAYMIG